MVVVLLIPLLLPQVSVFNVVTTIVLVVVISFGSKLFSHVTHDSQAIFNIYIYRSRRRRHTCVSELRMVGFRRGIGSN